MIEEIKFFQRSEQQATLTYSTLTKWYSVNWYQHYTQLPVTNYYQSIDQALERFKEVQTRINRSEAQHERKRINKMIQRERDER